MSESLAAAAEALGAKFAGAGFDGVVAFDVEGEGVIRVAHGAVSLGEGGDDPDVTISATLETFRAIFDGELSPTAAYMTGRMRIEGDMGTAMKLSQVLG